MTMHKAPLSLAIEGPRGISFDFNDGCCVSVPDVGKSWRVQLLDLDASCVLFDQVFQVGLVQSSKRYYVRFGIRVWLEGELLFSHDQNLKDQEVLVRMQLGGIGDHLAWMGHVAAFQQKHEVRLTCIVRADIKALLQPVYLEISFVSAEAQLSTKFYATYSVLIYFNDTNRDFQPLDFRQVGLCKMAAYTLGLQPIERRPRVAISQDARPFPEKYVCIATQGSTFTKFWHNPSGWLAIIRYLKKLGYRVLCIDRDEKMVRGPVWRGVPYGAENFTGNQPLSERAHLLKHAEFFIGLSSGLSWLAWAAETPVILISGFTEDFNEFSTPYRVINRHTCHGCANDNAIELDRHDFFWCPRHKDTQREFECSRLISFDQVKIAIDQVEEAGRLVEHG